MINAASWYNDRFCRYAGSEGVISAFADVQTLQFVKSITNRNMSQTDTEYLYVWHLCSLQRLVLPQRVCEPFLWTAHSSFLNTSTSKLETWREWHLTSTPIRCCTSWRHCKLISGGWCRSAATRASGSKWRA